MTDNPSAQDVSGQPSLPEIVLPSETADKAAEAAPEAPAPAASTPVRGRHAKPEKIPYVAPPATVKKAPMSAGPAPVTKADLKAEAKAASAAPDAEAESATQQNLSVQLTQTLPMLDVNATSAPTGRPIITLSHVTKIYPAQPDKPALNDVSLQIYAGEFIFLVGHSGSGKSTFIRMLTREIKPTSGHIYIADEDLTKMRNWRVPYLRRNVGCVFQDFKLLPNKTVFENVAFALEVIGKSRHVIKTQVPEVLRLVGLQEKMHKMPDQLSGGEQQRVSIARAIVNRPPLLICDEPTGNLDPQTSRGIMDLLERINRTGTTVLVATHDREMVDNMRRRVIVLNQGRLTRDQDRGVYGFDA